MPRTPEQEAEYQALKAKLFGSQMPTQAPTRVTVEEPSTIKNVVRGAGALATGFNEGVLGTIGSIPDAAYWAIRQLPGGEKLVPGEGHTQKWLKALPSTLGEMFMPPGEPWQPEPLTTTEKSLKGAGKYLGDAATMMAGGAGLRGANAVGTLANRIGRAMTASPGYQAASAATGGAVEGATDSQLGGFLSSVLASIAAPAAARKMVFPIGTKLSENQRAGLELAKQEGIPVPLSAQTGSRPIAMAESVLATLPSSEHAANAATSETRKAFTRAVMKQAGIDADNVNPGTIAAGDEAFSKAYQDLHNRLTVRLDNETVDGMRQLVQDSTRAMSLGAQEDFRRIAGNLMNIAARTEDDLLQGITPTMTGQQYQQALSDVRSQLRSATNSEDQRAYSKLLDLLKGVRDRSIQADPTFATPQEKAAFSQAFDTLDKQYSNWKTIKDAVLAAPRQDMLAGDMPLNALNRMVKQSGGRRIGAQSYLKDGNDMVGLARLGQQLGDFMPNSGTPERLWMTRALTGAPVVAAVAGPFDLGTTAALTAAGIAIPKAAQSAISALAKSGYLQKHADVLEQLVPELTPEQRNRLLQVVTATGMVEMSKARDETKSPLQQRLDRIYGGE